MPQTFEKGVIYPARWPADRGTTHEEALSRTSQREFGVFPTDHNGNSDHLVYKVVEETRTRTVYVASSTPVTSDQKWNKDLDDFFRHVDTSTPVPLQYPSSRSKYNTQVTQPPHIQVAKSSQRHLSQLAMQPSPTSNQPSPTGRLRRFYDREGPHFGFTNFSDHSVKYEGRTYRTGEHLFQAMKFLGEQNDIARQIRACSTPREAMSVARNNYAKQRPDWDRVRVRMMDDVLLHKFKQHEDLRVELLGTGDDELIENSRNDSFWGCGEDGRGRNELGKALERLREQLRHPPTTPSITSSDIGSPRVSSGGTPSRQTQPGAVSRTLGLQQPDQSPPRKQLRFYDKDKPHYGFTNFSDHTVEFGGKTYPTSEHLFQAFKFIGMHDDVAEKIRTLCPGPRDAFNMAHKEYINQRGDWDNVRVG